MAPKFSDPDSWARVSFQATDAHCVLPWVVRVGVLSYGRGGLAQGNRRSGALTSDVIATNIFVLLI